MEHNNTNVYHLIEWPEAQQYHDKDEYPDVEFLFTVDMSSSGAVFVPLKYLDEILEDKITDNKESWR